MKSLLVIFVAVAAAGVAEGLAPGLHVKFNLGLSEMAGSIGSSSYYELPRNTTAAKESGWTLDTPASSYLADLLTLYCYSDKVYCAYYDDCGNVAGLQFAILISNFTNYGLDFPTRGYTEWTAEVDGTSQKFYAISQYFISEDELATSKTERCAAYNSSRLLQYDYIWLTGNNGGIDKISTTETDMKTATAFTQQRCFPWMGRHYFYNYTASLECTADQLYPWFLLFDSGNLIGSGPLNIGVMDVGDDQRNWYETPSKIVLEIILSQGPDCIYDLADSPGLLTSHIYYVEDPRKIGC